MEDKLPTVLFTYNKHTPKYIHIYEKIIEKMLGNVKYSSYLYCVDEVINIKHKKVMHSTNNHYNSKIEQIKISLEQNGWVLDTHQSFYGQPDMVRNIRAVLKTPLKSKGSEYSIVFESKYPCVLSINYDQTGPDYFTADYWIQTCDDSKVFNSNIFGNDVRIHQKNAVNGSTDILSSVTQQMHNNFNWFTINCNK